MNDLADVSLNRSAIEGTKRGPITKDQIQMINLEGKTNENEGKIIKKLTAEE